MGSIGRFSCSVNRLKDLSWATITSKVGGARVGPRPSENAGHAKVQS